MHLAFLIAAHAHPLLLARLVRRLQGQNSSIFIHIDKRVEIQPFLSLFQTEKIDGITWVKRENSRWGTFGQIQATLSLLREAFHSDPQADRFIFISGQDYPLMKPEQMAAFFKANDSADHLTAFPMPWSVWGETGGFERLQHYHFAFGKYDFSYPSEELPGSRLVHGAYKLCSWFLPRERPLPENIQFYGGSRWWNLSRESIGTILDLVSAYREYSHVFEFSRCADEIFFQTLLLNAKPDVSFENNDLRCVFWDGRRNEFPATLLSEDFDEVAASGRLFARKIHPELSLPLLDRIDRELL